MSALYLVLALVALQRLGELVYARRNERRLRQRGGVEAGAAHYPLFILLHGGWLIVMALAIAPQTPVNLPLLVIFVVLQLLRLWVVASLGPYWTTRVITVPGEALVRRGPYRWLRHPNYLIVIGEIAVLPLVFGAWAIALGFSVLNGALLWHRIRVENTALAARR